MYNECFIIIHQYFIFLQKGIVIHELLHALGSRHEQSRPDRDDYVTIHTGNIEADKKSNFNKYTSSSVSTYNVPYDYTSIMHYGPKVSHHQS